MFHFNLVKKMMACAFSKEVKRTMMNNPPLEGIALRITNSFFFVPNIYTKHLTSIINLSMAEMYFEEPEKQAQNNINPSGRKREISTSI
jgi:hypothetical protein